MMNANVILKKYENKVVFSGGEVYLNYLDSLDFIDQCEKHKISIWGIDIVKLTPRETISPLDKTIEYQDQSNVYQCSTEFVKDQMDDDWNYATFVTD